MGIVLRIKVVIFFWGLCGWLWLASAAGASISWHFFQGDGITPFDPNTETIMAGQELVILVTSDYADDAWIGSVWVNKEPNLGFLAGWPPFDPKIPPYGDYIGSHLATAGENATVGDYEDSVVQGLELATGSDSQTNDWFVFDYVSTSIGNKRIFFEDFSSPPIAYEATIHQIPTRDINHDNHIDLGDFAILAAQWLKGNCSDPNSHWCQGADITQNGTVNAADMVAFADYWLVNTLPPRPDINRDMHINLQDFAILASLWQESTGCPDPNDCPTADINQDGQVNLPDVIALSEYWLRR